MYNYFVDIVDMYINHARIPTCCSMWLCMLTSVLKSEKGHRWLMTKCFRSTALSQRSSRLVHVAVYGEDK